MLLWIYTLIDIVYFMSEYNELFGKYYQEAEKYLQNMNLEERIGQMFFVKYTENASQEISKKNLVDLFYMPIFLIEKTTWFKMIWIISKIYQGKLLIYLLV